MSRSERKWDHIRYALKTGQDRAAGFDDITFIHQSLPDTSLAEIEISTNVGELVLSSPIFINAMTGGGGGKTLEINGKLARAAKETGVAMAVGSQMAAIKDPKEKETYQIIRKENPDGIIIGNLGSEATVSQALAAVEMIDADALQIHLNTVQELTMPEGDRNFKGALSRIEEVVKSLDVPLIVKEVGFGMSRETVSILSSIGVEAVDIGGFGGTNFARIENQRREKWLPFFNEWGIPTTVSIIEAREEGRQLSIIGSGGIQSGFDIAKALALGANATGLAGRFLKVVVENGLKELIMEIQGIHQELALIMAALGANTIGELQHVPLIISGKTHHWLSERGIDTTAYSRRNHPKSSR